MENKRKYAEGYKPRVCIANFKMIYYPRSSHSNLTSKNKVRIAAAMKTVKSVECSLYPIVLDENDKIPTKRLEKSLMKFVWKEKDIRAKFDDYMAVVRDIEVKSESRVCYKFDERVH